MEPRVEIQYMKRVSWCIVLSAGVAAPAISRADDDFAWLVRGRAIAVEPGAPASDATIEAVKTVPAFGAAGSWRWAIYGGGAYDFDRSGHFNLHVSTEYFLADHFSVNIELGVLYFSQINDTWGGNFNTLLRWHFLVDPNDRWTIYVDAGAGLLGTFEDVPDGGTSFDFTPQAGMGATIALGDDGTRLMTGVRWHHISNARTNGDENNPGRDSLMAYVGVSFPWGN